MLLAQQFPPSACTANLHWTVCHLPQQARQQGAVGNDLEFFIERGVQHMKEEMRNRITQKPETLYANSLLLDSAMAALWQDQHGQLLTFDDLCPDYRARPLTGTAYDSGDPDTGTQMLHKGRAPRQAEQADFGRQLAAYGRTMQHAGLYKMQSAIREARVYMHTQLHRGGEELITSRKHARSRSRISYYTLLDITGPRGGSHLRVARVEYYLRVLPAQLQHQGQQQQQQPSAPLRLAVCTVFKPMGMRSSGQLHVVDPQQVEHDHLAISVDDIVTLLVSAHLGRNAAGKTQKHDAADHGLIMFMQYNNLSRM